ncbi:MAG: L-serine ammonia-lyase, iron-sulfur-dependent, subunit alpha [Anaerolineaceae bacterium]|nr:L-serine ammonia-lyase, iron-sulfur-dependent, subunit alpha [Anaerolineaceae bacterium]
MTDIAHTNSYPEFYNDVFGPVMQPGSSSHTAGPCRLGYLANSLLGETPQHVQMIMDSTSSFSGTFGLMAEDRAMLAGALGLLPDDGRLFQSSSIADQFGVSYGYEFGDMKESTHPNAVKFVLTGQSGRVVSLVGDSTGGGMIETRLVNGYPFQYKGDAFALLLFDAQDGLLGETMESIAGRLSGLVGSGRSSIPGRGNLLYFLCVDPPDPHWVNSALASYQPAILRPVLAVLSSSKRKPQLFNSMTGWRSFAQELHMPLWEAAVQYEMDASGWQRAEVLDFMRMLERKMYRQTHAPYEEPVKAPENPFRPDMAGEWEAYRTSPGRLTSDLTAEIIRLAYGAGAGIPGVEGVAGPMGSGGGYIHAALWAVKQAKGFSDQDLLRGLFIAASIGAIAYSRTEPTGERIGCTGETGICGAMAAGAIAEMAGGTPEQVENAASMMLQAVIGLPCDPIPGGFGQPCRSRILTATCMAHIFADLALAGRKAVLPLHEAIDMADAVGRRLPPELLCTSQGGAACMPSAMHQAAEYSAWRKKAEEDGLPLPPGNLI